MPKKESKRMERFELEKRIGSDTNSRPTLDDHFCRHEVEVSRDRMECLIQQKTKKVSRNIDMSWLSSY